MAKAFKSRIGSKRLNTLIPDSDPIASPTAEVAEPKNPEVRKKAMKVVAEVKAPTPPESVVSTFRINTEKLKPIKAIAFWDRKKIQDVFDEALGQYIESLPKATVKKAIEEYTKRTS